MKYHQNNATTGTWLNLNRATYPQQLATPRVNAGNSALVPGYVRLAINKVRKALGIGQLGKLIAYTSVEQEHAWENLGITISQVINPPSPTNPWSACEHLRGAGVERGQPPGAHE